MHYITWATTHKVFRDGQVRASFQGTAANMRNHDLFFEAVRPPAFSTVPICHLAEHGGLAGAST
eukprot:524330-Alexandrium_andersonii.AAC.1